MDQKTVIAIAAIIVIIAGVVYFSRNKYGSPNPIPSQGPNQVSISNFSFNPAELNINAGDKVTWTNNDSVAHTISGSGFQSGNLTNGQTYSFTFASTGTYDYICGIHPYMKGRIIVK